MRSGGYICVIGASAVDLLGYSFSKLHYDDSNPGFLKSNLGGVGRNIAENLLLLGKDVKLITVIGGDEYGSQIIDHCNATGLDIGHSLILNDQASAIHLAIMDTNKDMALGLAAMDICDQLSPPYISTKKELIKRASLVVLDTNMSKELLSQIVSDNPDQKYFLDAVSGPKALKAKHVLDKIYILKLNLVEAEMLADKKLDDHADLIHIAEYFHNSGVVNVIITLGKDGAHYSDGTNSGIVKSKRVEVVNTNGAGDALSAGIISECERNNPSIREWVKTGMACAQFALQHERAVHPDMHMETVSKLAQSYE